MHPKRGMTQRFWGSSIWRSQFPISSELLPFFGCVGTLVVLDVDGWKWKCQFINVKGTTILYDRRVDA